MLLDRDFHRGGLEHHVADELLEEFQHVLIVLGHGEDADVLVEKINAFLAENE